MTVAFDAIMCFAALAGVFFLGAISGSVLGIMNALNAQNAHYEIGVADKPDDDGIGPLETGSPV